MGVRKSVIDTRNAILRGNPGLQSAIKVAASRRILPRFLWAKLQPFGEWALSAPDGTTFNYHCTDGDGLGRAIVWTNMRDWERSTQLLISALAKRVEYFVDVGAYSGIYTILASIANPTLRSVAFEPNPASSEKLRRNLAINGLTDRVTVVEHALSARAGSAMLSIPRDVTSASLSPAKPKDKTIAVTVTTGDEALGDLPVGLVKIDVEGFEPDVLLGMSGVLGKRRPAIIAECLNQAALVRLKATAFGFGYDFVYQIRADRPVLIDDRHVHRKRSSCRNYLFAAHPLEELI